MTDSRNPSPIDAVAETFVDRLVEQLPSIGTYIGRNTDSIEIGDYSPNGHNALAELARSTKAQLDAEQPVDKIDEVTKKDLGDTLQLWSELHDAGASYRDLNVIASPAQEIRSVFDLMATDSVDDWAVISKRLGSVGSSLEGYAESLREGIRSGNTPAIRQVHAVIEQVSRYTADSGFFAEFAANASPSDGNGLPASLAREISDNANAARVAYDRFGQFLSEELAAAATDRDAVGRELYALHSRSFLGAAIDLDETYEWGREELARMVDEQTAIADQIKPGASVEEAVAFLEADESRKLNGTKALQEWMQRTSDEAIADLAGTHFEIPEAIKKLECMIAPTQEGGIYYTGPTDDFSRPGRMWWSVPEGVTSFDTWRELTTVYHEGIPGHHLQIAQAVYNREQLNSWRRLLAGTSGHAEGWALYAERLMQELGYLDDPADRLGMLDGQRMRAARVVLDIGVHLEKPTLDGTGTWNYDYALDFMRKNVNMSDEFVQFEVNRYFGWPGQAPSYKVGQRIWEQVRDEYAARKGEAFNTKDFHKRSLDIGGVGLDTLRFAVLSLD